MVIGSGMLAKAFYKYENNDDIVIFASGVSNSKETDQKEFDREFNLLNKYTNSKNKLVYFSTSSIDDASLVLNSSYIKHKIALELYIVENYKNYLIFRLPNVIGRTINKNTLFGNIKDKILNNQEVQILKNASRYIIDVDDLSAILPGLIQSENRKIINVNFDNKATVWCLVNMFENIMNKKVQKKFIDGGSDYSVNNEVFMEFVKKSGFEMPKNYNFKTLKKYLT